MQVSEFKSLILTDHHLAIARMIKKNCKKVQLRWLSYVDRIPYIDERQIGDTGLRLWGVSTSPDFPGSYYEDIEISHQTGRPTGYYIPTSGIYHSFFKDSHWEWGGGDRINCVSCESGKFYWDGDWDHPPVEVPADPGNESVYVHGNRRQGPWE